jgi:hypothetical protein
LFSGVWTLVWVFLDQGVVKLVVIAAECLILSSICFDTAWNVSLLPFKVGGVDHLFHSCARHLGKLLWINCLPPFVERAKGHRYVLVLRRGIRNLDGLIWVHKKFFGRYSSSVLVFVGARV